MLLRSGISGNLALNLFKASVWDGGDGNGLTLPRPT